MKNATLILLIGLLASIGLNVYQWRKGAPSGVRAADTVTITDTIKIIEPQVVESLVVRTVVKKLKIVDTVSFIKTDTVVDSIKVEVPITSRTYQDSDYIAWVSGYLPRLDSIQVYRHERVIRQKERRWVIGFSTGYGVTPKGLSPYAGIGVTIRLY